MKRHRVVFDPSRDDPFEVSRSQIESFLKCPACYWMRRRGDIKFPGMPGFLLNTATDTLLKKDFDKYRELGQPHPFMERQGLGHLVPFNHPDFETWTKSLQLGLQTTHEASNLIVGGGLDDVWYDNEKDELFVVDYKSTAGKRNDDLTALEKINLQGIYKQAYRRQMDMYQWILRENGFNVSNTGYFVYVNGDQHFEDGMLDIDQDKANMMFDVQLIKYVGDDAWVPSALMDLRSCLESDICPDHASAGFGPKGDKQCEYATLFDGMKLNGLNF